MKTETTPKSMRLQIGIFGRTNVGKSSFLNMLANQDVAMTSSQPGTTTDVVEKSFELLPIGPVVFLDTAGFDDTSILADKRLERTKRIFNRADVIVLLVEPNVWTDAEQEFYDEILNTEIPFFIVINKIDTGEPSGEFIETIGNHNLNIIKCSSVNIAQREQYINEFKNAIINILPQGFTEPQPLIGDLLPPGGIAVLIVPIDMEAPKGRIILPQVQAIRGILDNNAIALVVKENEYFRALQYLTKKPDLVVCDSQVVMKMVAETPLDIKCTTFSILFSRFKGDLNEQVRGAAAIEKLHAGDKILIAEACSHHANEDDIGRVKLPRWLTQYLGSDIQIDYAAGRDYPDNLSDYKVIIHCGGCMLTGQEMKRRIYKAVSHGIPITNYGMAIALTNGVLERVLLPFENALKVWQQAKNNLKDFA
ncbi:MAG: small GTP-binding protein [Ignavibacteria bacterium]|nr:small GTP-binding protein [Ignavibacteria bacterium]